MQLERAWNALTWTEKLSLVSSVVRGITSESDFSQNNDEVLSQLKYCTDLFEFKPLTPSVIVHRQPISMILC